MKDPYATLGVKRDAGEEEITAAYRALAKKYHPDLNPDDKEAAARMRDVNEAYTYLREHDAAFAQNGANADGARQTRSGYSAYGKTDSSGYWREYTQEETENSRYRFVREALSGGEYQRALMLLSGTSARDGMWYYLAACAHNGTGNRVLALHYAKTAAELEPYREEFELLYEELRGEISGDREKAARRAAVLDTVKRVLLLFCALGMVGSVIFQACVMG
ncbi:MAG: DnaJ domain-containing protein [Clostridia bacterium]|nr:DnaJ domain-containing protein [Clostridia bacterium]